MALVCETRQERESVRGEIIPGTRGNLHGSVNSSVEVHSNVETNTLSELQSFNGRVELLWRVEPSEILGCVHLKGRRGSRIDRLVLSSSLGIVELV